MCVRGSWTCTSVQWRKCNKSRLRSKQGEDFMASDAAAASVRVAVRLRPMNENEKSRDTLPVVTASTEKAEVTLIRGNANRQQRQTYNFDEVHSSFSTQRDVFETAARPLVKDVVAGFEGTVRPPSTRGPIAEPSLAPKAPRPSSHACA